MFRHKKKQKPLKYFDRGITARNTYDEFTENNIQFVSRLNNKARYEMLKADNDLKSDLCTGTLKIISDNWCFLYNSNKQKIKHPIRRIETVRLKDNKPIVFITNIKNIDAAIITEIYKRRWDIEVFFKFIKQLLNFKHLTNRSENGIQVMLYVTMIATVLLIAYKKN